MGVVRCRRVDCAGPGYSRRRAGTGWSYRDEQGRPITDREVRARIAALAIPPAWTEVWICPDPRGHLQAVGRDAAGRRQYRYHDAWRQRRDGEKFDRMLEFARRLPTLRAQCDAVLDGSGAVDRESVLACAVRLLDLGFFRIGSEEYARLHGSFGLTTIRRDHVRVRGDVVVFDYVAKHGVERQEAVAAPGVVAVVQALRRRRGGPDDLLAWKRAGRWVDVKAEDVNGLIRDAIGEDFSAKDFRTWGATVLAAVAVAVAQPALSETARRRVVTAACREVGHHLGNTTAVARASYIDPRVFDRYRSGWTVRGVLESLGEGTTPGAPIIHGVVEQAVVDLLTERDSDYVEHAA